MKVLFFKSVNGSVLAKAHVKSFVRKDGSVVKEHDDSRSGIRYDLLSGKSPKKEPAKDGIRHDLLSGGEKKKESSGLVSVLANL